MQTPSIVVLLSASLLTSGIVSSPLRTPPSDPFAVYGILDKVELLPDADQPTRITLHGAFAVAEGARGVYCRAPARGVMHFALGKDVEATRTQWKELARLAGTGKTVGFGSRYESQRHADRAARIVGPDDVVAEPPPFAVGWSVQTTDNTSYGPLRELMLLPRCTAVDLGDERQPRELPQRDVVFTATNCIASDSGLRYVFQVTTSDGDRVGSGLVEPGKGITTWRTQLGLQLGEKVTWSVQVVGDGVERAPLDVSTFTVPAKLFRDER